MARFTAIAAVGPLGAITLANGSGEDDEAGDFRQVPSSDRGDAYDDRGKLGSYAPSNREPFENPSDVRMFAGYGATESDLERGFVEPAIREDPAYDKSNYQERSTMPRQPNEDMGETDTMEDDWQFRNRNRLARGFLTRPRIPTERG